MQGWKQMPFGDVWGRMLKNQHLPLSLGAKNIKSVRMNREDILTAPFIKVLRQQQIYISSWVWDIRQKRRAQHASLLGENSLPRYLKAWTIIIRTILLPQVLTCRLISQNLHYQQERVFAEYFKMTHENNLGIIHYCKKDTAQQQNFIYFGTMRDVEKIHKRLHTPWAHEQDLRFLWSENRLLCTLPR